jgi:hypothetical protein
MPGFMKFHGVICTLNRVTKEETIHRINPDARLGAVLKPLNFSPLLARYPDVTSLLNEDRTLLKNVTISNASGNRNIALQINHRSNDGPKLTTSFGIPDQFEQAYLKACKKLAAAIGYEKKSDVVFGLYSTLSNFKSFYGYSAIKVNSSTMEYVTSTAVERNSDIPKKNMERTI